MRRTKAGGTAIGLPSEVETSVFLENSRVASPVFSSMVSLLTVVERAEIVRVKTRTDSVSVRSSSFRTL